MDLSDIFVKMDLSDIVGLRAELLRMLRYPGVRCRDMVLDGHGTLTYFAAAEMLVPLADRLARATGLWAISRSLKRGEVWFFDHREWTERELCFEAITTEPSFSNSYNVLATTLNGPKETLTLPDGRCFSKVDLYREAIRFDETNALFYCNLSSMLSKSGETITLHNGRIFNRRELCMEAMRRELCMEAMRRELCMEAMRREPTYAVSYTNLAITMADNEQLELPDGRVVTEIELYLQSLQYDPDESNTYYNIGCELSGGRTATLGDGRVLNRRLAYSESLRCDPQNGDAFYNLGSDLSGAETAVLFDGRCLNKEQLLLEAFLCRPEKQGKFHQSLLRALRHAHPWARREHVDLFGELTNQLFATFRLGLQRLEETGVLPLAHQAMLEDMLECWTWDDTKDLRGGVLP